ncbi:EDC1 [Candida theae]|uniref:EDC1 n=1 Tax=Candida theae TaxID=1198502 RepID=A0AAD5BDJ2_9ASCO|nr:EDC1 [Candida theae]KAI5957604.1 EDC1 [Candida theae]
MMAHEVSSPIQINENTPTFHNSLKKPLRQNRKKQSEGDHDQIRFLPSGAPVDFGNGSIKSKNNSSKKLKEPIKLSALPSLPNGERPKFHNDRGETRRKKEGEQNSTKVQNKSKKSQRGENKAPVEISLPNGEKPNFTTSSNGNGNGNGNGNNNSGNDNGNGNAGNSKPKKNIGRKDKGASVVVEEDLSTYAGSSFHSSPAALNLPKPNFKPSPKQSVVKEDIGLLSSKSVDSLSTTSNTAIPTPIVASPSPSSPSSAAPTVPTVPAASTTPTANALPYPPNVFSHQLNPNHHVFAPSPYTSQQTPYPPQGNQVAFSHHLSQPIPPPPLPPNQFYNPYLGPAQILHHHQQYLTQTSQPGQKVTFNQLLGSSK